MLETLIKTYYNYIVDEAFTKKVIGLIYSNLFKKNPDKNFKLIFEIKKDERNSELILTTSITDYDKLKLPVRKERVQLDKHKLDYFDKPIFVKSKDLVINFNKTHSFDSLYSAIESFEVEALNSVVDCKLISESKNDAILTSVTDQKKLLKSLGYQSWIEPKLIFRTLINTTNFEVSNNSYESENSEEYSKNLDIQIRTEQLLLKRSLDSHVNKVGILGKKGPEAKVFFWLLEGLISDDVAGLSTFVPNFLDDRGVDFDNYTRLNALVEDFISLISKHEQLSVQELIEAGVLGDHTPALLAIAGLLEN